MSIEKGKNYTGSEDVYRNMSSEGEKMNDLKEVILFFIPHFITEDMAILRHPDGSFEPVCSLDAVDEDDYYNDVVSLRAFTWFGMAWGFTNGESRK